MRQNGNIFFALFGAVGMVGMLGASTATLIKGPVSGMARVTDYTVAKNDMTAALVTLSQAAIARPDADCDGDGMIEPPPPRMTGGKAPAGGGLIPAGAGASMRDPWGTEYGYCAWDHGFWTTGHDIAACGGANSGRRSGAGADTHPVIAFISAGPNGVFETSCHDYINDDRPLTERAPDSDDLVRLIPYGQFIAPMSAMARLDELPDAACTAASVGLMRIMLGVMQICTQTGWAELSPSSGGEFHFVPVTNATIGARHQSNEVRFGTLAAPMNVNVTGGATLSVSGGPPVTAASVSSHDTLVLHGAAPAVPEATHVYMVTVGQVTTTWSITTRDAYIGRLSITPAQGQDMSVQGPGAPAYGPTTGFIVSNVGERPIGPLLPATLASTTHFSFNQTGSHVGDDCAGKILQGTMGGAQSCVIDIRPHAAQDTPHFEALLLVGDGDVSVSASLVGSATGWGCHTPWGEYIANGAQVTAYQNRCALLGCTSQSRKCANGELNGSYQHPVCNALLSCL